LDESCISNPKSEISDWTTRLWKDRQSNWRFRISDLRCRIRPISKSLFVSVHDESSMLVPQVRRGAEPEYFKGEAGWFPFGTTPSAPFQGGFAAFFDGAATPPDSGGE